MKQLLFDFSETLIDPDGDKVKVDLMNDTVKEIQFFLKCTKLKAAETLRELKKKV